MTAPTSSETRPITADEKAKAASYREHVGELAALAGLSPSRLEEVVVAEMDAIGWTPDVWLERPNLPGAPEPELLPVEVLPSALRAHVESVAGATQTAPELGALLALAAVSAAVAGTIRVRVDGRGWAEPVNLYVAAILPPGARKSAVFRHFVEPLLDWERDRAREVGPRHRAALDKVKAAEAVHARAVRDGDGIEDARTKLDKARAAVPRLPRMNAPNATPEKLIEIMAENAGRIAQLSPEGGPLRIADGRYSDGGARLEELKQAYDGEPLGADRIGREGAHVRRPALTLALTLQPGVLESLSNRRSFRGEGFLARVSWLRPDPMLGRRLTGADVPHLDRRAAERYGLALRRLLDAEAEEDEDKQLVPRTLELTSGAREAVYAFEAEIEAGLAPGGDLEGIADWAAKAAGRAIRLAALLELAGRADAGRPLYDPLGPEAVEGSVRLVRALMTHARAVLDDMGLDSRTQLARYVLRRAVELPPDASLRDLFEATKGKADIGSMADLQEVVEDLAERRCLRIREVQRDGPGRPPSPFVEVHADIRTNRTNMNTANTANANPGRGEEPAEPEDRAALAAEALDAGAYDDDGPPAEEGEL